MIPSPHSAFLTANEKDFSLSLEMTMREGGTLPPSPWKEAVRRGGGSLSPRDERECETALSRIVIPSAVEGSFSFAVSVFLRKAVCMKHRDSTPQGVRCFP